MTEDTAGLGHNNPPEENPAAPAPVLDQALVKESKDVARAALERLKAVKRPIETVMEAEIMNDAMGAVVAAKKTVEANRVKAKKPFDEAAAQVQTIFKTGIIDVLDRFHGLAKEEVNTFRVAEQARADAEAEARRAAAREEEERAFAAKQLAEANGDDLAAAEAEAAAEEAAKRVDRIEKVDTTVRIGSATGETRTLAARTVKTARITNIKALALHFINDPKLEETLQALANAAVRAAGYVEGSIPGIEVDKTKKI